MKVVTVTKWTMNIHLFVVVDPYSHDMEEICVMIIRQKGRCIPHILVQRMYNTSRSENT